MLNTMKFNRSRAEAEGEPVVTQARSQCLVEHRDRTGDVCR